ncbi:MAG: MBL fold metallo-hydrolase [Planctomycetes bacterium]|nr:MBL fold metallo-hydrolase [Planctomycetota bacterium]
MPAAVAFATEATVLFEQGDHRWIWLGTDDGAGEGVPANQYLVQDRGRGLLLDPGSVLDFARTISNLSRFAEPATLDYLFFSHQDPDVSSGVPMWAGVTKAKLVMPAIWARFLPHFGEFDQTRIQGVPDKGSTLALGKSELRVIPAHFLHSTGNIVLYDPVARYLFTGDIGTAIMPPGDNSLYVQDFSKHLKLMEGFHKRYMASNAACRNFVERINHLAIDAIVPQHGRIIRGDDVKRFKDWFRELRCGVDLLAEMYR